MGEKAAEGGRPKRSPAKRVRFGEEEQGSEGGMPARAFRGKRTLGEKAAEGGRPKRSPAKRVRFGEE
ncbi:hypothetical protein ACEVJK_09295, partial [Flintibacter sp. P01028]